MDFFQKVSDLSQVVLKYTLKIFFHTRDTSSYYISVRLLKIDLSPSCNTCPNNSFHYPWIQLWQNSSVFFHSSLTISPVDNGPWSLVDSSSKICFDILSLHKKSFTSWSHLTFNGHLSFFWPVSVPIYLGDSNQTDWRI